MGRTHLKLWMGNLLESTKKVIFRTVTRPWSHICPQVVIFLLLLPIHKFNIYFSFLFLLPLLSPGTLGMGMDNCIASLGSALGAIWAQCPFQESPGNHWQTKKKIKIYMKYIYGKQQTWTASFTSAVCLTMPCTVALEGGMDKWCFCEPPAYSRSSGEKAAGWYAESEGQLPYKALVIEPHNPCYEWISPVVWPRKIDNHRW